MHLPEDYVGYDATSSSNCCAYSESKEVFLVLSGKLALEWASLFMQL